MSAEKRLQSSPRDVEASVTPQKTELQRRANAGPCKPTYSHFEDILSVPLEFQNRFFRWVSEVDVCDRAVVLGKALDVLTAIHCHFLSQFTNISDVRARFLQAPTPYMVTSMYFCDRTLDGIVHSIASIRGKINTLYTELRALRQNCDVNYNAAQKMYREVEADARPNMMQFIEERKAKATVFRELSERIGSILDGGDSMYRFLGRMWCEESQLCQQIRKAEEPRREAEQQRELTEAVGDGIAKQNEDCLDVEKQGEDGQPTCTPEDGIHRLQGSDPSKSGSEIPQTPEGVRPLQPEAPITQVSRKGRGTLVRKRARIVGTSNKAIPIANSLLDGSPPSEAGGANAAAVGEKSARSLYAIANVDVRNSRDTTGNHRDNDDVNIRERGASGEGQDSQQEGPTKKKQKTVPEEDHGESQLCLKSNALGSNQRLRTAMQIQEPSSAGREEASPSS